ncbi:MAG TPA: ArsC family reductase [Ferruginibacter sp.]|jgi:Spx/MgsR family transcriptional regulator|nr:ArsC family reductase [Ferruginibacter sp.]
MAAITVYGIPNCDTTKKAIGWLKKNNIDFSFHDYKLDGVSKQKLSAWCDAVGWERIFNKRSTTWRELTKAEQVKVVDQQSAIKIMMANNSIIKRPVIETDKKILVGFNEGEITKQLK